MKVVQTNRLPVKSVDIGGFYPGISRAAEISVTLVIRNHENYIGFLFISGQTFLFSEGSDKKAEPVRFTGTGAFCQTGFL